MGPRVRVFRTSMSRVPWRRSPGLDSCLPIIVLGEYRAGEQEKSSSIARNLPPRKIPRMSEASLAGKLRRFCGSLFKKTISVPRGILTSLKNDYRVAYVLQVFLKKFESRRRTSPELLSSNLVAFCAAHHGSLQKNSPELFFKVN